MSTKAAAGGEMFWRDVNNFFKLDAVPIAHGVYCTKSLWEQQQYKSPHSIQNKFIHRLNILRTKCPPNWIGYALVMYKS